MVLDAKALTWAAKNNIDTAKLKAAKIPIYGKWYFPELPAGVALINLETGERQIFPERMIAGEVIWVSEAELRRANLLPPDYAAPEPADTDISPGATGALRVIAPEPLLAIARPPGYEPRISSAMVPVAEHLPVVPTDESELAGIHMPSASIAPFVMGVGFCITMLGTITTPIILVVGLVWMLVGAVGWIRIGLLEAAHTSGGDHSR
jgi:hypothetical protein